MRNNWACFLIAAAAIAASSSNLYAADAEFAVVVNPRTGSAVLRNDTDATVNIDGYLFVATQDTFNASTSAWNSLTDQSVSGWLEGQANDIILSETNLGESLAIAPGGTVDLGTPYDVFTPTAFGEAEPTFQFSYSIAGAVGADRVKFGEIEFEVDNNIVLVVNPVSGAATMVNQSGFDVSIDSYLIQSPEGVLDASGWTTLESNIATPDWTASTGSPTRISEGNLFGSLFLAKDGGSVDLGTPIDPSLLEDESDLVVQFSTAIGTPFGGEGFFGSVLFVPPTANTLLGDFNTDGLVDTADYTVWRDGFGTTYDINDYLDWKGNFGASAGSAAATSAVPEPSTALLAISLLLAGRFSAKRRR